MAYMIAFSIGIIAGLRAMTAPAAASWAARTGVLDLGGTWMAFIASAVPAWILTFAAAAELVTDQLPDTHFSKKIGTAFHEVFKKVNGGEADDGFSGYAFDGWVVFIKAAEVALTKATPGTQEFRQALMDAIYANKDVAGVHAVYNFSPKSYYGVDERSLIMVKLNNGKWTFEP